MKIFKKALSILMASVIMVTAFAVTLSAASIEDTAKIIDSGKKISDTMYGNESVAYKINISKKGILKIHFTAKCEFLKVFLYDKNGNRVDESDVEYISGGDWSIYDIGENYIDFEWNEKVEKIEAKLQYTVEKGTYYIEFYRVGNYGGSGKLNFTATFPSSSSSSSAKISYLSLTIPKNSSIQLGAILSAKSSSSVKWSSSKSSIASVSSKGKVTAKKKGSAVITAKLGSSSIKIKINVK